uniref:Uncharacterized protein n=1 Tax=Solanum lycopersicum TaxID=4081 RepID=A0A3Q7G6V4_SOLLC
MAVHGSGTLVNLEVVGPLLKLRHLEILYCNKEAQTARNLAKLHLEGEVPPDMELECCTIHPIGGVDSIVGYPGVSHK